MKNKNFNLVILLFSTVIMMYFFIFLNGSEALAQQWKHLNKYWIILAMLCMGLFWIFETTILHIITKALYKEKHLFIRSFKFTMLGQFFGAFTPFSSGSQPAQIFAMTEVGIPAGSAASILMIKFIIHEVVYLGYLIIALVFKFNFFNSKIDYFLYFCFFGFLLNIIIILFCVWFSVNNKIPKRILGFLLKILGRVKLIKNPEKKYKEIELELVHFHDNAAFITKNKKVCALATIVTFFQWTAYYTVPYLIYRGFGFSYYNLFTMITAQVFLTMFMSCIPIPGAEGGAEAGFYIIFGIFFKGNTIVPAILIWRMITYYLNIAVGSIFAVFLPNKIKHTYE